MTFFKNMIELHNLMQECTKLSSRLVAKPLAPEDVKRCVLLVVLVLRKCRHKGAIESAGIALYQITQQVTSRFVIDLEHISMFEIKAIVKFVSFVL